MNIEELFTALNVSVNYIVLRNYEGFPETLSNDYHNDIDILCDNKKEIIKVMRLQKRSGNRYHYYVKIGESNIPVDVRTVGDGYFCSAWEDNLLSRRVKYKNLFFVPCKEDYYYSLLYHVLIQKKKISSDYQEKLCAMEKELFEKNGMTMQDRFEALILFLKSKKYYVTNTSDPEVILNFEKIDRGLLKINKLWSINRKIYHSNIVGKIKKVISYVKRF